jgi:hypothetical protein
MGKLRKRQAIANLPAEARKTYTPGTAWALAGLRTYRLARCFRSSSLLTHASRSMREQCRCGCSFLFTDAGQSRISTGFPLGVPAGTAASELRQYMV